LSIETLIQTKQNILLFVVENFQKLVSSIISVYGRFYIVIFSCFSSFIFYSYSSKKLLNFIETFTHYWNWWNLNLMKISNSYDHFWAKIETLKFSMFCRFCLIKHVVIILCKNRNFIKTFKQFFSTYFLISVNLFFSGTFSLLLFRHFCFVFGNNYSSKNCLNKFLHIIVLKDVETS